MKKKKKTVSASGLRAISAYDGRGKSRDELVTDVLVSVTREDIDGGRCHDPHKCALARALRRVVRPGTRLSVDGYSIAFGRDSSKIDLDQESIEEFVERFDECRAARDMAAAKAEVRPTTLRVSVPLRFMRADAAGELLGP